MKLTFILFAFFFNFLNPFLTIKAEEIIYSSNNQIANNLEGENSINKKSDVKKVHIVIVGDTITSISKLYSIEKEMIINLNNLKDENYIYVGQNLKISDSNTEGEKDENIKSYHIVQKGDNLTDISLKYGLKLEYITEINNLKDEDSIVVGSKLFLSEKNKINQKISTIDKVNGNNKFRLNENRTYGPLTIQQKELEKASNRKIVNAKNQNKKNLIISLRCETKDIDVRIPGKKWRGWLPAKEEFEKDLLNDFC